MPRVVRGPRRRHGFAGRRSPFDPGTLHTHRDPALTTTAHLRKALHAHSLDVLHTEPGGYVLRVDLGQIDVRRFERALEEGQRALAGAEYEEAAETLRAALAEWRGNALANVASSRSQRSRRPAWRGFG